MSEKKIKARLQQKHDTSANWALATNFKPKAGELIIYDDLKKMKVGDGETLVNNLPFLSADVSQPDYNQNDSTAADYIKNRPFYEETPTIETILDQTFSTIAASGVNFWATNTSVIQFVKGDTVKVVYNGTEYMQEVKELNAVLYVGNIGLGGLSPATDEPFLVANIYFPDGLSTLTPGTTVATSAAQTNATIKITKEIENVKTIDPKYIKDMYYENIVETELHNGTLTNAQSASGEYYTATLSPFFRLGEDNDKLSVTINNVEKILTVVSHALWEEAGSLSADGITIESNTDGAVTINTNTQYTNATIIITNIHSDVHSIPQKYVNSEEYLIEISVTSISDEDIALALKKYLNDNPSELNAIRSRTSWVLKAVVTNGDNKITVAYRWTTHSAYGVAFFNDETLTFTSFSRNSIDAADNTFKTKQATMEIIVYDRIVRAIKLTSTLLLDNSSWNFGVVDNIDADTDPSNGTLALYSEKSGGGYCDTFNGIVTLHNWITKAQQRSDFAIPAPTKDTDLVDKKYADTAISNAITNLVTLDTEQTINGLKTYAAPANISGTEQVTTKFMTSNGGSISIGKEDANSGTMLRFDQVDGTCRLKFRASATAGSMVWEQPEKNAALYFDMGNSTGSGKNRVTLRNVAGTLALTKELPAAVSANPTLSGSETELTGLQIGSTKYKIVTQTYVDNAIGNIDTLLTALNSGTGV